MNHFKQNNGSILLVEDNSDDVELTLRAFRKKNIPNPVVVLKDGEEAIEYLFGPGASKIEMPALVLLDIKLPKINGLEVMEEIRNNEKTKLLPVVVLTTSNDPKDVIQSYSQGANSYIRKPVDFQKFVEAIGQLGLYWLLLNEPRP